MKYFIGINRKAILYILALLVVCLDVPGAFSYITFAEGENSASQINYVPGEVIVKLKEQESLQVLSGLAYSQRSVRHNQILGRLKNNYRLRNELPVFQELHRQIRANNLSLQQFNAKIRAGLASRMKIISPVEREIDPLPAYILNTDQDVEALCQQLNQDAEVEYAQPNYIMQAVMTPNDPRYDELWGIQKLQCASAWDVTQGEGAVVAVIDTGIDYNHEDLRANMWQDANGRYGYDFANNDSNPMDDNGHGSHVAGTIAAVGNNSRGVIGVAPKARLMAVKGLNASGSGSTSGLAQAIRYAADNGADVLSNSWGGTVPSGGDRTLMDALSYAVSKGCVIVAAAGNSNADVSKFQPARYDTTIAVAATTADDRKASFSNYGSLIDVAAPGVSVLSTSGGAYKTLSGTSMSCPHVSGVAALVKSLNPNASYTAVRKIIRDSADDLGSPGKDIYFGYGRVNAAKACNSNAPPPDEPPEPPPGESKYGDVSGNGEITAYDASLVTQYITGKIKLTQEQIRVADVSGNGELTSYDASLISQYVIGLIKKFPVEE